MPHDYRMSRRAFVKAVMASAIAGLTTGLPLNLSAQTNAGSAATPFTPFDGKIGIAHWKGEAIPEATITAMLNTLKQNVPSLGYVTIKAFDGQEWQGTYDSGEMAVNSREDVIRWVDAASAVDLDLHLWGVPKWESPVAEAILITTMCTVPGVKSLTLDIENYEGYWTGDASDVEELMNPLRRAVGDDFHIALAVDPRIQHYEPISPAAWRPYINSVHPLMYWTTFGTTPTATIEETFATWGEYGLPMIPYVHGQSPSLEIAEALGILTEQHQVPAITWWRHGTIENYATVEDTAEIIARQFG